MFHNLFASLIELLNKLTGNCFFTQRCLCSFHIFIRLLLTMFCMSVMSTFRRNPPNDLTTKDTTICIIEQRWKRIAIQSHPYTLYVKSVLYSYHSSNERGKKIEKSQKLQVTKKPNNHK